MCGEEKNCWKCGGEIFVKNGTSRGAWKVTCQRCQAPSDRIAAPEGFAAREKQVKAHPEGNGA